MCVSEMLLSLGLPDTGHSTRIYYVLDDRVFNSEYLRFLFASTSKTPVGTTQPGSSSRLEPTRLPAPRAEVSKKRKRCSFTSVSSMYFQGVDTALFAMFAMNSNQY
jgi:hypothetical protein